MCGSGQLLIFLGFLSLFYFNLAVKCHDYNVGPRGGDPKNECEGNVCINFTKNGDFIGQCCDKTPLACAMLPNDCAVFEDKFAFTTTPLCSFSIPFEQGRWKVCCCNKKDYCNDRPTTPAAPIPGQKPAEVPGQKPGEVPGQKPGEVPGQKPGDVPGQKPGDVPGQKPEEVPGQKPGEVPGQKPGEVPGQKPEEVPGQKPEEVPGQKPGEVPGQKPGEVPGQKPEEVPGQKPGENPGQKPGEVPGQKPGEVPDKPGTRRRIHDKRKKPGGDASKMVIVPLWLSALIGFLVTK